MEYNNVYDNDLLFKKVEDGDEKAYTELFHFYTPRLYPYILKITKDEYIAKELLQETFLRLWAKRTELKKVQNPGSWLFKVAANICLMHLRTEANRNRLQGKVYEKMKPGEYAVAKVVEEKELEGIIAKVVESLSPQKKVVYKLSRQEEFYAVTFRKKLYNTLEQLQKDLDDWLNYYNNERPHSGRYCYGKTPMQTFNESITLAKQKLLNQVSPAA